MNTQYTHIVLLLDKSGSMKPNQRATISGVNEFLHAHRAATGRATVTLVQFDHEFEIHSHMMELGWVPELTALNYVPRGNTALLGAMAKAIDLTGDDLKALPESLRPSKVLFVVVTDGQENASHYAAFGYTGIKKAEVTQRITRQTGEYKWEFVYIGANQNAIAEAQEYGISGSNALNYTANDGGTKALYASVADKSVKFRTGVSAICSFDAADRKAQEDAK